MVEVILMPSATEMEGRAMLTTLLSKGVVKALSEVTSSTIHLYESSERADDNHRPLKSVVEVCIVVPFFSLRQESIGCAGKGYLH